LRIVRFIAYFLLLLFAGVIILAVWLFVPLSDMEYVRVSQAPTEFMVAYSNETCDPLCTKLYAPVDGEISDKPIFPRVAADLPHPHDDLTLRHGDRLMLRGYRYELRRRNLITGDEGIRLNRRMDVVAWRGPAGNEYISALDPTASENSPTENYIGCR